MATVGLRLWYRMRVLDLFSGIGGMALLLPRHTMVMCVESDPLCQAVLQARMLDGSLPEAPIHGDIRTLEVEGIHNMDLVSAGFPCQDISGMGHRCGLTGVHSGLFFEVIVSSLWTTPHTAYSAQCCLHVGWILKKNVGRINVCTTFFV